MSDEQQGTSFTHPLTAKLHPDPNRFGNRVTVVGYPGPSPQAGRVRVYLDTTFSSYYELDEASVLDAVPSRVDDENSPTVVVIESSTPVDVVRVETGQTQARYLEGSITGAHLATALVSGAGGALAGMVAASCVSVGGLAGFTLARQQVARTDGTADCFCVATLVGTSGAPARAGGTADCFCVATLVGTSAAPARTGGTADCFCVATLVGTSAAPARAGGTTDCFCVATLVGTSAAPARTGGTADCFCVATLVGTSAAPAGQRNVVASDSVSLFLCG